MSRIYNALIELVAATVFIIPVWCVYEKIFFQSWKRTLIYMTFGFYLVVVLALVGFPNITMLQMEFTVNLIPFIYMLSDFVNACLNVLLFVPFGFFLPMLWKEFRSIKKGMHNENRFAFPFSAEKEGFEPSRRVTDLLVFEARLFSHLSTSPK